MKKIVVFTLAVMVFFTLFAGCSSSNSDDNIASDTPTRPLSRELSNHQPTTADGAKKLLQLSNLRAPASRPASEPANMANPDSSSSSSDTPTTESSASIPNEAEPTTPTSQDLSGFYNDDKSSYDLTAACKSLGYEPKLLKYNGTSYTITFLHPETKTTVRFYGLPLGSEYTFMDIRIRNANDSSRSTRYTSHVWFDEAAYRACELIDAEASAAYHAMSERDVVRVHTIDAQEINFSKGSMQYVLKVLQATTNSGEKENPFLALDYGSYWSGTYHLDEDEMWIPDPGVDAENAEFTGNNTHLNKNDN